MLTGAIVLAVLWLIGMLMSYTFGGFIHVLLVAAVVMFIMHFMKGKAQNPMQ